MADLYIMDRSEYILKRIVLLRTWEAPTISDVRKNFGDDLAEKIFCNCEEIFREDYGLVPPLRGPMGRDLWSSPSDLLIGKVCLKPPLTSKHIKALTHQGILDIGLKVEKLFWNQMEIEKSKELAEQERTLKLMCETSKREAISEVGHRMMKNFRSERLDLVNEIQEICKEELIAMKIKYENDLQDELEEQEKRLEEYYQILLEEEKLKRNEVITNKPSLDLQEVQSTLQRAFQAHLQRAQIQAHFKIQAEQARCKEQLKILRHELECKNLANMMYLMCMERKKSNYENAIVKTELTEKITHLTTSLENKNEEMEKIKVQRDDLKKNVDSRESALSELIKEFQKFINFALKAVPKQAEYLLCAEKLLVFEFINALSKAEVPKDKDDDHDRNYLWDRSPPRTDSTPESLRVKDGHDCLKEPERTDSEISVNEFLPGFHYNDQLFVREDFRNMVSQGIKVKENDMLWTKHVRDIQDQLELPYCQSCLFNEFKDASKKYMPERKRSNISYQSSVHFSVRDRNKSSLSAIEHEKGYRRTSLKTIETEDILQTVDFNNVGSEEKKKTLIGSKNSVELLKENIINHKSSLRCTGVENVSGQTEEGQLENLSEEKEISDKVKLIVDTKDSLLQTKMRQALESTNEMNVLKQEDIIEPKKNISKLITVTDSLEIMKRKTSKLTNRKNLPEYTYPKLTTSEELAFELPEEYEETLSLPPIEPPRKVSIVFNGKSVIYDEHEHDIKSVKQQSVKSSQDMKKRKKLSPRVIKHHQRDSSRSKNTPTKLTKEQDVPKPTVEAIVGDSKMEFSKQNEIQFSTDRINSFINIIKEHPNLIRLFTSVIR